MPIFEKAERVVVNGGNFVEGSININTIGPDARKGEGIRLLLDFHVQHEAIHDSDSRGDLGCHPGTREEYIRNITSWGSGQWESGKRAFLMTGPAGAGKSAIARTCAYRLEEDGHLGASFFFYRPNGWNDPRKFIPTIVYQLTTFDSVYRDCINAIILGDRLVFQKSMDVQFRELLTKPLQKLSTDGPCIGEGMVIIVDGLDECATVDVQVQIIELVATSIRKQTTPFSWAFFSRPEPPIISAFSSKISTNVSWRLPLTLSGNADSDIEEYLRGSFQVICARYSIPASEWPSEADIHRFVSQSAGLFIYSVTAIRYIGGLGKGTSGLEERLQAVLELDPESTDNPFSALDQLYRLIVMQIPEGVLLTTLSLLYLHWTPEIFMPSTEAFTDTEAPFVYTCCYALGLSSAAFHVAISNLHSILEVRMTQSGKPAIFRFYHRSFEEFLRDTKRSKQYYIFSPTVNLHCLEAIVRTMSNEVSSIDSKDYDNVYITVRAFFALVQRREIKLDKHILQQFTQIDWSHFHLVHLQIHIDFKKFIQKIPRDWRSRIIRPYSGGPFYAPRRIRAILMPERYKAEAYILGKGDKKGLIMSSRWPDWYRFSSDL